MPNAYHCPVLVEVGGGEVELRAFVWLGSCVRSCPSNDSISNVSKIDLMVKEKSKRNLILSSQLSLINECYTTLLLLLILHEKVTCLSRMCQSPSTFTQQL